MCSSNTFQGRIIEKVWTTYQSQPILSSLDEKLPPPVINNEQRPDIAVIKLTKPFDLNKYVIPVCLPEKELEPGSECFASGWGHTKPLTPIDQQNG